MSHKTTDLCDAYEGRVRLAAPLFQAFGGLVSFSGPIATVRVYEDNSLVRERFSTYGQGRVLIVDGGGSRRCALIGDRLAQLGLENGWAGAIVHGCIRDAAEINAMAFGIRALGTCPLRSTKGNGGEIDVPVFFADVLFRPGEHVYVDADGILVAEQALGVG
jgi:regulator of ribonuclease activity A